MVDPIIDYNRVEALPYKKTVAMVNNFIINTTQFLNRFTYLCDKKLAETSRSIQRLETTMNILEGKLASVPGLEGIQGSAVSTTSTTTTTTDASTAVATTSTAPSSIPTPPPPPGTAAAAAAPAPAPAPPTPAIAPPAAESAGSGMTNQNDPRYARYFKMLKLGVPAAQIRQKMMFEGVDPDILDNPDGASDYKPEEEDNDDEEASSGGGPPVPPPMAAGRDDDDDDDEDEDEDDFDDD